MKPKSKSKHSYDPYTKLCDDCGKPKSTTTGWEKAFDTKFPIEAKDGFWRRQSQRNRIIDFIKTIEKEAYERGKQEGIQWNRPEILKARLDEAYKRGRAGVIKEIIREAHEDHQ